MLHINKTVVSLVGAFGLIVALSLIASGDSSAPGDTSTINTPTTSPVGHNPPHTTLAPHVARGVNYAHIHRGGMGYGSDASKHELTNLQGLGIDWVALTPFGYQQSVSQDHVAGFDPDKPLEDFITPNSKPSRTGRDASLTDRHLADQVADAHALGVKVLIKPHIWSRDFWRGEDWHGTINQTSPQDHERWRKSYLRFMLHYARLAHDTNADALCIGTELVSMTTPYPDDWRKLIREVKKIYSGKITYAAHWDTEFRTIPFWDDLDTIGISAYFPLDVQDDATVDQLVDAWQPHKEVIEAVQHRFNKPIVFLEVGYRPATGAYRGPWLDSGGTADPMIQARAYEALFRTYADESWWHGLFIWKVFTDAKRPDNHDDGLGFSFRNRPAERVIEQWFSQQ
jgi:hypothetical protein